VSQGYIDTSMNRVTWIVGKEYFAVIQVGKYVCSLKVIVFLLLCPSLHLYWLIFMFLYVTAISFSW